MFLNFTFAVTATITLIYMIFYPKGAKERRVLEILHYSGILFLITYLTLIIVLYEFKGTAFLIPFIVVLTIGLIAAVCVLLMVELKISQFIAFGIVSAIVFTILAIDCFSKASIRMKKLFYEPLFTESVLVIIALILFFFRIPELCCPNTRWVHLYLSS